MKYPCPCCGYYTHKHEPDGSYDICPVCFWEDDPVQLEDPQYEGGANHVSLEQARLNYKEFGACEEKMLPHVRKPDWDEMVIREWKVEDKYNLAKNLNNKKVLDNLRDGLPYPYTEKDAEEFITEMISADKTKTFAFAITVDDIVIGSIGIFRCDNIHYRTAEMGYYIGEEYWGKGIGTSAVRQACAYVFDHTDIIRIFAEPFAYNEASCRVLEKAGFVFEGILQSNAVKNGEILDMKMYALVKENSNDS